MVDFEVSNQNERDITYTLLETSRDSMTSRVKYISFNLLVYRGIPCRQSDSTRLYPFTYPLKR